MREGTGGWRGREERGEREERNRVERKEVQGGGRGREGRGEREGAE